jgi:hypothetical protein
MSQERAFEDKRLKGRVPDTPQSEARHDVGRDADRAAETSALLRLQQQAGNRAVQRLIAQSKGDGGFDLDDTTTERIERARGSGQPLDGAVQKQASAALGHDLSGVRVHDSPESDDLNRELGARAFTTGQDVFFRQGAYDPGSGSGRELIAHELSHVVQQTTGQVGGSGGGRTTVRPAGDTYEQEADSVARSITGAGAQVQLQADDEDDELQMSRVAQQQEEEEELQASRIAQRQEEEEELQMSRAAQRQEEEEELQASRDAQRQEEEEELQTKAL